MATIILMIKGAWAKITPGEHMANQLRQMSLFDQFPIPHNQNDATMILATCINLMEYMIPDIKCKKY